MTRLKISSPAQGQPLTIGSGFQAQHFGEQMFNGLIDPVVMVDHFHMTSPTFEPHPHAGISAVTYMFEDASSPHVNYDSMGNQGPIVPGALHWLAAGRGAVHTEQPEGANPHVHALQIFVNLPASKKMQAPFAVHAEPADIPEYLAPGVRVRIAAGSSNGIHAAHTSALPEAFTLLDGFIDAGQHFTHQLPPGWNAMLYAIDAPLQLSADGQGIHIPAGSAIGIGMDGSAMQAADLELHAAENCHFVLLSGPALREPLVKHGPFVMNSSEEINDRIRAYQRGEFGQLTEDWLRNSHQPA
ncbi:pirin family protein [Aquitalea sp. USM4]|uniref:pirin family protein n=1 Tax=Aquitalea sp. USM4 TaxID=1590041 RepID=UPI00103D2207|nr:pirin-like C-terminal cupin domain-containing protein [Aquitalea sp. USM4]QBJ79610.1 pirin family protein [Aquitalea sp. USM4]